MTPSRRSALLAVAAAACLACRENLASPPTAPDPHQPAPAATVVLADDSLTIAERLTTGVSALGLDANGEIVPDAQFVFSSRDTSIAAVSALGVVTARRLGRTRVVVSWGAARDSLVVIVRKPRYRVQFNSLMRAGVGDTPPIVVSVVSENGVLPAEAPTFTSSNTGIVTIAGPARYRAVAQGSAFIRAAFDGSLDSGAVVVEPQYTVDATPGSLRLAAGDTAYVAVVVHNYSGQFVTGLPLAVSSSDSGVALPATAPNRIIARNAGAAVLRYASGDGRDSIPVTVELRTPTLIVLPRRVELLPGDSAAVSAQQRDTLGVLSPAAAVYTTDDAAVARVSGNRVIGVGIGQTMLRGALGSLRDSVPVIVGSWFPSALTSISIGARPFGIAAAGGYALVTRLDNTDAAAIDLRAGAVIATANQMAFPLDAQLSVDGKVGFVLGATARAGSRFSMPAFSSRHDFPVTGAGADTYRVLLSRDETMLYITTADGRVIALDAATGGWLADVIVMQSAINSIVQTADGRFLVVTNYSGTVGVVDARTLALVRTVSVSGLLQEIVTAPDGSEFYVARENRGSVVLDAALAVRDTLPVTGAFGLRMLPNGRLVASGGGRIVILDAATRQVVRTYEVGGAPRRIAWDDATGSIVVANENGQVHVIR